MGVRKPIREITINKLKGIAMRLLIKRFLLIYLPLVLVISGVLLLIFQHENQQLIQTIETIENNHIEIAKANIALDFEDIDSDLRVIANLPLLHKYLDSGAASQRDELAQFFQVLSRTKKHYDKIRYLDANGQEVVRINYNHGNPTIVPPNELQDKSSRYFFMDTFKLNQGEVYVSPFDLNSEEGRLEIPYKPSIRFGTPVFDSAGSKRGILLLNYLGDYLLTGFHKELVANQLNGALLNSEGYWLSSTNPADEWGFMLGKPDRSFSHDFSDEWRSISASNAGTLRSGKGLFIYNTVLPLLPEQRSSSGSEELNGYSNRDQLSEQYYWKIVSFIPQADLENATLRKWRHHWLSLAGIYLSFALAAFLVASLTLKRKQTEQALLEARQENESAMLAKNQALEQSCRELETQRQIAESASKSKSEFLTNMSHEIRTPMNGVLGMLDILRNTQMTTEQSDLLQTASNSAEALLAIINDILDISRLEAGKIELESIPFNLAGLVKEVCSLQSGQARAKMLEITCLIPVDFPACWQGDPTRIHQVLTNLVGNAIKFTEHGEVLVKISADSTETSQSSLRFEISDTGIGISPETQARLFKPFTQADSSTARRFGGTGLGLSISKTLVTLMGGEIGVESQLGKGTCFWFTLPLALSEEARQSPAVTTLPVSLAAAESLQDYSSKQVLMVEDNLINQKVLLAKLAQFHIKPDVANNGVEALEKLAEKTYDLVLMDCQMPIMDGYEATGIFREREAAAQTPRTAVIALTAHATTDARDTCLNSGMDDYLSKPINRNELTAILVRWLET
jgi:signal transduction histidine kinase/ActR/RegA family two-component response regulator